MPSRVLGWRRRRAVLVMAVVVCAFSTRTWTQDSTSPPDARPFFQYTSVFPVGTPGAYDGAADIALFDNIRDVVISPAGVMFVADGHAVRRVAADGAVTTVAGSVTEAGDVDSVGTLARFGDPVAIAADAAGVVFVADSGNHTIRRIAPDGTVTTVAGRAGISGSANGEARFARLFHPNGIIVHPSGAVYFTEQNCLLRRLTTSGVVEPVTGAPGVCASVDGSAEVARLEVPVAIAADASGIMYVADATDALRRITTNGTITTIVGSSGGEDTTLSFPRDVTVTPSGAVRVLESWATVSTGGSHSLNVGQAAIRDVAPDGTLTLARLLGVSDWSTQGRGLAYDAAGSAYWGREDGRGAAATIMVGEGTETATVKSGSGSGRPSLVNATVAADASGILALSVDEGGPWPVRRVSFDGTLTTLVASLPSSTNAGLLLGIIAASGDTIAVVRRVGVGSGESVSSIQRVTGGTSATFATIPALVLGLAAAPNGGFFALAEREVFEVSAAGVVQSIAGDGQRGHIDGPTSSARFDRPHGAVYAPNGDLFIADTWNHVIRRISGGQVTTIAGVPGTVGWVDGSATTAHFNLPTDLALMPDGSLIVHDQDQQALRRVDPSGAVSTIALPAHPLASNGSAQTMAGVSDGRIVWANGHELWLGSAAAPVALTITEPPTAHSVQTGDDAVFSLVASGAPVPVVEWQESIDGGGTWARVSPPAGPIANRYTLVLRSVNAAWHGRQYRAVVTDADETVVSTPVTLSVTGLGANATSLSFLATAPSSGSPAAAPQTFNITVPVAGTPWTVTSDQTWLAATPSSGSDAGAVQVSVDATAMTDGQSLYGSLRLTAPSHEPVVIPVHVRALRAPTFTQQPRDYPLVSMPPMFFARVSGLEYTVRWEQSDDGALWTPAAGTSYFSLSTWWLSDTPSVDGRWYRALATNAAGTTISTHVRARRPTMAADHTAINFRGWRDQFGTTHFLNLTAQVQLTEVSWWTTDWTVTSPVPWLEITPGTGSGAGTVTFTLRPEFLPGGSQWTVEAEVLATMVNSGAVDNASLATIAVGVTAPPDTSGPFGQVDTPLQSATGVQGSIAVTGWVLDDIGVARVDIYRECVPFDVPGACASILGRSLVFVGRATIVPGARPDVEAAYPNWPEASRAGWGFLMLTPMLPHVPGGRLFGGQGPVTIHAIATDMEGTRRLLGRSANPLNPASGDPTFITLANDSNARPFGAIDTPAQGATVSGLLHNFGWVLTPDTNTFADPSDILVPIDGSGVTVFIDGVARGTVNFNFCRGSAGPIVAPGDYCDDDVSSIFGHATPQPLLTPRGDNPTVYRNLDSGRGAIGFFPIDTTTLTNGRHSISWGVTDSLGRTVGVGSRFFTVDNPSQPRAVDERPVRRDSTSIRALRAADRGVWARAGFDGTLPWNNLRADDHGRYHVTVPEAGRLELWLGAPASAAFIEQGADLAPLPPEATLEGAQFSWAPPAGYLGTYRLIFVRGAERVEIEVRIGAAQGGR